MYSSTPHGFLFFLPTVKCSLIYFYIFSILFILFKVGIYVAVENQTIAIFASVQFQVEFGCFVIVMGHTIIDFGF